MVRRNSIEFKMSTIAKLVEICASEFKTTPVAMQSKTRKQNVVFARHIAMYIMRNKYKMTYYSICFIFNRTHATAIHAIENVENMVATDKFFREKFESILEQENNG